MPGPKDQLLSLLEAYQRRSHLTDEQMAKVLGIGASSWNLFRRGKRSVPAPGILAGFARLYPRRMALLRAHLLGAEGPQEGDADNP